MSCREENPAFVFIVGCPRSGTFLGTTLLSSHFHISIPIETHFIPLFKRLIFLWGDLKKYKNRKKLLKCIYDFLEIWTKRAGIERDYCKLAGISLLATIDREDSILKESCTYSEIVSNLFKEYAQIHGTSRFGDKSAFYHHVPFALLQGSVKKIKVIHIVRDGRDVSLSWKKTWFGPETIAASARVWASHIQKKRDWGKNNPDNYLEIKYEDLLDSTDDILRQISVFLDIPYEQKTINTQSSEFAKILSVGGTHQLLSKPLDKGNKEKWKTLMSEKDLMLFEYIAGPTLESCGYDVASFDLNLKQRSQIYMRIIYSYIVSFFSVKQVKLRLKSALPLVLFISAAIRFPLKKFLNRNL